MPPIRTATQVPEVQVICKCTQCRPISTGPGRLRSPKTRANHISADRKRLDTRAYGNRREQDFLNEALRETMMSIDTDAERAGQPIPGPRAPLQQARAGPGVVASDGVGSSDTASAGDAAGAVSATDGAGDVGAEGDAAGAVGATDGAGDVGADDGGPDVDRAHDGGAGDDRGLVGDEVPNSGSNRVVPPPALPPDLTTMERHAFFRSEANRGAGDQTFQRIGHATLQELLQADFPIKNRDNTRPTAPPSPQCLTRNDHKTPSLLIKWVYLDGKDDDYEEYGDLLRDEGFRIASLFLARKLAAAESGLEPEEYDMCPNSCVAYLGHNLDKTRCPECRRDRYDEIGSTPLQTFYYIPFLPRLQAMYSTSEYSNLLRYRADRSQDAKHLLQKDPDANYVFRDLHDGYESAAYNKLTGDDRDCFVAITSDGAQLLSNRKNSHTWMVLLQNHNLPPSERFSVRHHHPSLLIPGPSQPKDLDTFLWPLCAELAHLSERGAWTWDGAKKEWFLLRVHLSGVYADQKGSVKLSQHVGGNGTRGCRFCDIKAVFADNDGNSAYFPLHNIVPETRRNRGRSNYNPLNLPHRTKDSYDRGIRSIQEITGTSRVVRERTADVVRETGMTGLPIVAFSRLYGSPYFFPIDPFHVFHLKVPGLIWKTWKEFPKLSPTQFGLSDSEQKRLGHFMVANAYQYPACFSSRIPRDLALSSNTNYRMVEWAATFHHFLPAFLYELGAPQEVQDMLVLFLETVDMALTRHGLTSDEIEIMRSNFSRFVQKWEAMYATNKDELSRSTISVHQLLHVADQMLAIGSVKATSQASCERYLGSVKGNMNQTKQPYKVVQNRAVKKTRMHLITIRQGLLPPRSPSERKPLGVVITANHKPLSAHEKLAECALLRQVPGMRVSIQRYGRLPLRVGAARSTRAEWGKGYRCASNVVYIKDDRTLSYAEVIEYIDIETTEGRWQLTLVRNFQVVESRSVRPATRSHAKPTPRVLYPLISELPPGSDSRVTPPLSGFTLPLHIPSAPPSLHSPASHFRSTFLRLRLRSALGSTLPLHIALGSTPPRHNHAILAKPRLGNPSAHFSTSYDFDTRASYDFLPSLFFSPLGFLSSSASLLLPSHFPLLFRLILPSSLLFLAIFSLRSPSSLT
ncbi:hypothetical protein CF326_g5568 [Tilletia indica]|nr:hypothetical protein CF326_g5568 [Tilletia indica]